MKARLLARWFAALGVVALLVPGSASAADVQVMISAGFYEVYAALGPAFERASGHRLVTTRGPSLGDSPEAIPTRLARGEIADVVILDGGSADELAKRGVVRASSKVLLARSQIGMVVRAGPRLPISARLGSGGPSCLSPALLDSVSAPTSPPSCSRSSASRTRWQARVEKYAGHRPANQWPRSSRVGSWRSAFSRSASSYTSLV